MKSKTVRYSFVIAVAVLLTLATTIIVAGVGRWSPSSQAPSLPPPPTPGPPPTDAPYKPEGGEPVRNRDEAIERALLVDSTWAARGQPLTKEKLAANPDMIIVEQYATRQEASDVYGFGTWVEPGVMSEPVWVVRIKGKASVRIVGGSMGVEGGDEAAGFVETDGVTYVISQKTGYLLAMSTSAQTWSERSGQD